MTDETATPLTAAETDRLRLRFAALVAVAALGFAGPALAGDCGASPASGIDWSGCNKPRILLPSSTLDGANLSESDLNATDLSGSNLNGARFEKARMIRTSVAGATAQGTDFARIEAYRSNFSSIKANGANFSGAELQRAEFNDANLTGANFEKAELSRVDFSGATLTDTRFALSNLSRARLAGAKLGGQLGFDQAFLYLTRIEGLDLSQAKGLTQEQVDLACGDNKTKLPAGLTTPGSWPCAADQEPAIIRPIRIRNPGRALEVSGVAQVKRSLAALKRQPRQAAAVSSSTGASGAFFLIDSMQFLALALAA